MFVGELALFIFIFKSKAFLPVQLIPSPWNPSLQLQEYDPFVFVHRALDPQSLSARLVHSFIS
mgnify:FL=1